MFKDQVKRFGEFEWEYRDFKVDFSADKLLNVFEVYLSAFLTIASFFRRGVLGNEGASIEEEYLRPDNKQN